MKKTLLLIAFVLASISVNAQLYEIQPDTANCIAGKISQSQKEKIIKLINNIRSHHKLGAIYWNYENDTLPQSAALSMSVTNVMSHDHVNGKCTNAYTDSGRSQCNLMHGYGYSANETSYINDIIGWLIDDKSASSQTVVGHRRLIINPFLTSTAFGTVNASSALWGITGDAMGPAICENDFVAYPYENYPPSWVKKDFYLSFGPIPNVNSWWSQGAVDFSNAKITMTDSNGNNIAVSGIAYDYVAWGCFQHNISWKAAGLKDSVKYNVKIENVLVNASNRTYTYWFKLTDEPPVPPKPLLDPPTLKNPANNAENIISPVKFVWDKVDSAMKYQLQLTMGNNFNNTLLDTLVTEIMCNYNGPIYDNQTYSWRVATVNTDEVAGEWSNVFTFKSKIVLADPPVAVYPLEGDANVARVVTYRWTMLDEAITYDFQIAKDETFTSPIIDITENYDNHYAIPSSAPLDEFTDYYWRVRAYLLSDNYTKWSAPTHFKTNDQMEQSVAELSDGTSIKLYPNPFTDNINIVLYSKTTNDATIEIFNSLGVRIADVYNGTISANENHFSFKRTLENGVYFCKVRVGKLTSYIPIIKK